MCPLSEDQYRRKALRDIESKASALSLPLCELRAKVEVMRRFLMLHWGDLYVLIEGILGVLLVPLEGVVTDGCWYKETSASSHHTCRQRYS